MTEFTKDIKTLTKEASSTPQLQTNTGSLGTDVLSAVGFGLDLYRKNKAQTNLTQAKEAQADYQTLVAENSLKLRDFNNAMGIKGQNIKPANFLSRQTKLIRSFGDQNMQAAAIKGAGDLKAQSAESIIDDIESEAILQAKNEQLAIEDRQKREVEGIENGTRIGMGMSNVLNMTDDELRNIKLQATIYDAKKKGRLAEAAEFRDGLDTEQKKRAFDNETFQSNVADDLGMIVASQMDDLVLQAGGITMTTAPQAVESLIVMKSQVTMNVNNAITAANKAGKTISIETKKALIANAEADIDRMIDIYSSEDKLKTLNNQVELAGTSAIVKMVTTGSPLQKKAGTAVLQSKWLPVPADTSSIREATKFVAAIQSDNIDIANAEALKNSMRILPLTLTSSGKVTDEQREFNEVQLFNLLNQNVSKQKALNKAGVLDAVTKGIVAQGTGIVGPESGAEIADSLYRELAPAISGNIAKLMRNSTSDVGGSDFRITDTDVRKNFTLNIKTMQLEKTNPLSRNNKQVDQVNTLTKNALESFKIIGMSNDYIDSFKEDVLRSFRDTPIKD